MNYKDFALQFVGIKQGSARHKEIIDGYNNGVKPLPRSYRVTYSDSWCATFVSYVMLKCGATNAPYECSCYYMKKKATTNKQIVKTPKINDLVIYDWGNNGTLDHVGIITEINGNVLTVVEGNKSKQVGVRTISKNSSEIDCYIRVPNSTTTTTDLTTIANEVIKGKYGNGDERKKALESMGYNYREVQAKVNDLLKQIY